MSSLALLQSLSLPSVSTDLVKKRRQYHSPQHVTGSLSECSINLGAQLVQSSFLQSRDQLASSHFRAGKSGKGGGIAEHARQNSKLYRGTHVLYSHSFCSPCCPPSWCEYKGKFGPETWFFLFSCKAAQHLFGFFFISFKFHPQSRRGVGVKCVWNLAGLPDH